MQQSLSAEQWPPTRRIIVATSEAEKGSVRAAQRLLGLSVTGELDTATKGHLRGIQRLARIQQTGCLDPETAAVIDKLRMYDA